MRADALTVEPPAGSQDATLTVPWQPARPSRRVTPIEPGSGAPQAAIRPIRSEARARLVAAIARARTWLDALVSGEVAGPPALAEREGVSERSVRMMLNLAFLSPALVKAAIDGTLPHGAGLGRLAELPLDWSEQQRDWCR